MHTVFPIGTTMYKPKLCSGGYNLISGSGIVKLVDMNGRVVHSWAIDPTKAKGFIHRARLLPSGRLMLLFGPGKGEPGHVAEFDWDSKETWRFTPGTYAHHDFWPTDRATVFLICSRDLPPEYMAKVTDPARRAVKLIGDELIEVNQNGKVVWRWVQHEHLDVNWFNPLPASQDWPGGANNNTITDWTHTNTIQELPPNKWFDAGDQRFKPGNILQSMRQLDTISIVDRDSGEVVWSYTGDYNGGLSGQHEPHMIEKHLPGAGNILVFDNGASPLKNLAHSGCSYVLEINPRDNSLAWVYDKQQSFYARFTANCQRLPNGNTLIFETACRRLFEVTPGKETVWEYILIDNAQRAYRYPYGHCPQFDALGKPQERSVTPSAELRIEPDPL